MSWVWEDTVLYERALSEKLTINREQYYDYGDSSILHLLDGVYKDISLKTRDMYNRGVILDGLNTLKDIVYYSRELLDIESFTCSFSPNDNTVVQMKLKSNIKPTANVTATATANATANANATSNVKPIGPRMFKMRYR